MHDYLLLMTFLAVIGGCAILLVFAVLL